MATTVSQEKASRTGDAGPLLCRAEAILRREDPTSVLRERAIRGQVWRIALMVMTASNPWTAPSSAQVCQTTSVHTGPRGDISNSEEGGIFFFKFSPTPAWLWPKGKPLLKVRVSAL